MYPFFEKMIGKKVIHTIYISHKKHLFVKNILRIFDICKRVQACQNILSAQLLIEKKVRVAIEQLLRKKKFLIIIC